MTKPLRALIVEDAVNDAMLLLKELERGGYAVTHERVESAETLRAALEWQPWDVVFSDYTMPRFDGFAALTIVKATGFDLPFIFVSGSIGEDTAVEAMRAGAHDYIMKGNLKRLLPAVERELREAQGRRERRRIQEELRQSEERFRQMAENITEVFWMTDPDKREMLYVSPGYETIWGRSCESLYERPTTWLDAVHADDRERVMKSVTANQVSGGYDEQYRIIRPDGSVRWIWDRAFPIRNETGLVYRVTGIAKDITERKEAEDLVQRMAFCDALTDLPNRNMLYDRLQTAIRADGKQGGPLGLLLMDLDHFKDINDTLGHHRGDLLLQQVGARLQSVFSGRELIARLGGDEFAVLLPNVAAKQVDAVVEHKILKALEAPFLIQGLPIAVEASIGVALYPEHGTTADSLLQRADVAMYAAKKSGRYVIYDPTHDQHTPLRLALLGELRHALDRDQLSLHYQPKVDLTTRQVTGVEALARWQHPEYGFIPPDQFIPPTEQTGLIRPFTRWVLSSAFRQCEAWRRRGLRLDLAVNISARSLHDPQLPGQISELLKTHGMAATALRLEITESAIMEDPGRAIEILKRIRESGIHLSLDDFGTGYSSLGYLKELPVDEVKIDKSFVKDLLTSGNAEAIVRSTIDLGHHLGLKVVAEGVEDEDVWNRLAALGCDAAQGYYMSRPLPTDALTHWLDESPWGFRPQENSGAKAA
jgi:diguanylate cyclase (GGDEF)-like protein/PAS domain S-box-containing protein